MPWGIPNSGINPETGIAYQLEAILSDHEQAAAETKRERDPAGTGNSFDAIAAGWGGMGGQRVASRDTTPAGSEWYAPGSPAAPKPSWGQRIWQSPINPFGGNFDGTEAAIAAGKYLAGAAFGPVGSAVAYGADKYYDKIKADAAMQKLIHERYPDPWGQNGTRPGPLPFGSGGLPGQNTFNPAPDLGHAGGMPGSAGYRGGGGIPLGQAGGMPGSLGPSRGFDTHGSITGGGAFNYATRLKMPEHSGTRSQG